MKKKGEELGNELQLIYIFRVISVLPDISATSLKLAQHPYTSLFQYAFGLYFTWGFPCYPCPNFPLSLHDACEFCVVQGVVLHTLEEKGC